MINTNIFSLFRFIVLLITVLIPNHVLCQDEQLAVLQPKLSEHSIGLGIGINDFHQKDQYLSPFIYRGSIFSSMIPCA